LTESVEPLQCWGHNKRSQHDSRRPETLNREYAEPPHPSIYVLVIFAMYVFV
jgi:hypothetical protein